MPWFGYQLFAGNSLIGARAQVYPPGKLLKGAKPDVYRDNHKIDLNGSLAVASMTDEEMRAELAQLAAKGRLKPGDEFWHESIIGSIFKGRVEAATEVGGQAAIIPSIAGWARMTGYNTIFIDDRDPFAHGFVVR